MNMDEPEERAHIAVLGETPDVRLEAPTIAEITGKIRNLKKWQGSRLRPDTRRAPDS